MKTIRDAYGEALVKYGQQDERIMVLDADVSGSTKSCLFQDALPERFFNVGIAEANMTAMAAGMAAAGCIPFVNSFAVFLTSIGLLAARTLGSYAGLPIKMIGAYGGLSDSFDGPSHHSIEDISIMRALPNYRVFVASDAVMTDWLVKNAIENGAPTYIRLSRNAFVDLYEMQYPFQEGKAAVLREGKDVSVIACGLMVGNALAAAEMVSQEGISARVIDLFTIKPVDRDEILRCAALTGAIVTAEEHSVIGGLGGAVAEVLCREGVCVPVIFVGLQDCHAECGPYQSLQRTYGLDANAIASAIRCVYFKKSHS